MIVGVSAVSLFNFKFLPYSVEKETQDSLKFSFELNEESIALIKEKCNGGSSDNKTSLLVLSNLVHENVKVNDENSELYNLQTGITDISNFILTYLGIYGVPEKLKLNLLDIINNDGEVDGNLELEDSVIAYSMKYVMKMFKKEGELI